MRKLIYPALWFIKARFFGMRRPLQSVIFISDKCNLRCKHCNVYNLTNPHVKTFEQVREELEYCYRLGSRFIDFEGGEPFLWRDGDKDVNDLIRLAKRIGFFSTTVTTNAQLPFKNCAADSVWVSMDGIGKCHDEIRGPGAFERLKTHIDSSGHKALSVNMVINTLNHTCVREAIKFAEAHSAIKSISLNFHTPYEGTEDLFLDWDTRRKVIDEIIRMKREGYPIMNSISGLKLMKHNDFDKECWISNFILADGTRLNECPGKTAGLCDRCGFCMAGEMHSLFAFKPDTLLAGMKLRMK